jgi:hypothetical protein
MIISLIVLLVILKSVLALCIMTILLIAADFIYFEINTMVKRDRDWTNTSRHMIENANEETAAVNKLIDDSMANLRKAKIRAEKEAEAWQSFSNEGYYRGFNKDGKLIYRGTSASSDPDWVFYNKVDEFVDGQIFTNTEEL